MRPDPKDCNLITRDPVTGTIQSILDVEQNAGSLITSGIDVVLRYALPTPAGRFRFWLDGNYLIKQDVVLPSGKVARSAGNYDLKVFNSFLGLASRLRFNTGIDYGRGPFTAGVVTRYISGFDECVPPSGTTAGLPPFISFSTSYPKLDSAPTERAASNLQVCRP